MLHFRDFPSHRDKDGQSPVESILDGVRDIFSRDQAFYRPRSHLCFVCGAQQEESLRGAFLRHLKARSLESPLPVIAEEAIDEFLSDGGGRLDLADFEVVIADVVDSILIFPESPGSFAELGYFSALPQISSKTLVVNKAEYQGSSFINQGPIPLINKNSQYHPIPMILPPDLDEGFGNVVTRLIGQATGKREYRRRFELGNFSEMPPRQVFVMLYEILRAFGYLTEQNLKFVLRGVVGDYKIELVRKLMALLVAMDYVKRTEHGDYYMGKEAPALLEYKGSAFDKVRITIMGFYQKHDHEVYARVTSL